MPMHPTHRGPPGIESGTLEDPLAAGKLVGDDLLGPEPEGDLALGRGLAVAAVDEVVLLADREVAPHRARRRRHAARRAEEIPDHRDRLVALEHPDDHRGTGDEPDQALEERFALVLGIVLLG